MGEYRKLWDDITSALRGHGLVESNWKFVGEEQSQQLEESLWEALVLLYFKDRGYSVERTQVGNNTNLDGKITPPSDESFFIECNVASQGDEESAAHISKTSGKRESKPLEIMGVRGTFETLSLSGAEQVSDNALRRQLRFTNAFAEKHKQITKFFGSAEVQPSFLFLNSFALHAHISSLPSERMPTSIFSHCVNALFGLDGIPKIQLDQVKRTAKGFLEHSPEIKKPTESDDDVLVSRAGFVGDSLKNISGILHCTRQPSQLAILYLTDQPHFQAEMKTHTEFICNPKAEHLLFLNDYFDSAVTVTLEDDSLKIELNGIQSGFEKWRGAGTRKRTTDSILRETRGKDWNSAKS